MKKINQFITEYIIKKKLDKPIDSEDHSEYFPKTKEELIENIKECFDNKRYNLNCIDTSKITDMSYIFKLIPESHDINFDVSGWDVSNVEYMQHMFFGCKNFDCDLSDWNVGNITDMTYMFDSCTKFKGKGLENWNVSNVTKMVSLFAYCENFDCDLSKWNVHKVENMSGIFFYCTKFKGIGLEKWNVKKVKNMNWMFEECTSIKKLPSWYKE